LKQSARSTDMYQHPNTLTYSPSTALLLFIRATYAYFFIPFN
jgi:hypothetical protein